MPALSISPGTFCVYLLLLLKFSFIFNIHVCCILFDENKLISAEPFLVHKFIPKNIKRKSSKTCSVTDVCLFLAAFLQFVLFHYFLRNLVNVPFPREQVYLGSQEGGGGGIPQGKNSLFTPLT